MDTPNIPSSTDNEPEQDVFPLEPRYHPIHKITRKIYDFLASSRLAMVLLVTILVCCVTGVTVWRGAEAGRMIFGTLWFNGILVMLVVNVACCFFGRIWGRRITIISFGMILFHLSFVIILLAIVYNSLYYFRGNIRLTEGETLPSGDPQSYDKFEHGSFFSFSRLQGDTTLVKMHAGFKIGSDDKRVAYEVAVGKGTDRTQGLIYITNKLSQHGVDYFNDREGFTLLLILSDKQKHELYGGYVPLQSIKQKDGKFLYTSGYTVGDTVKQDAAPFPAPPAKPLMALNVSYTLSKLKERSGEAEFIVYPLDQKGMPLSDKPTASGKAPIGGQFVAGEHFLSAAEVRYWAGMTVRYEPGKPIILSSLMAGLAGMLITTIGRIARSKKLSSNEPLAKSPKVPSPLAGEG